MLQWLAVLLAVSHEHKRCEEVMSKVSGRKTHGKTCHFDMSFQRAKNHRFPTFPNGVTEATRRCIEAWFQGFDLAFCGCFQDVNLHVSGILYVNQHVSTIVTMETICNYDNFDLSPALGWSPKLVLMLGGNGLKCWPRKGDIVAIMLKAGDNPSRKDWNLK